jgi:hypothetical protein
VFEYGASEGIGFMFSSGDSGYEDPAIEDPDGGSDKLQVDYPTSSPCVTSVDDGEDLPGDNAAPTATPGYDDATGGAGGFRATSNSSPCASAPALGRKPLLTQVA